MIEVVCHPCRQELSHGDETELRVTPAAVEVRVGEPKRFQRAEVFPPERSELVEELRQRSALRHRELRKAIELLEGSGLAVFTDDSGAGYPVGPLAVDQVSDDVEGAPRVTAFVGCDPALGQAPEERIDGRGRPRQDGNRFRKRPGDGS